MSGVLLCHALSALKKAAGWTTEKTEWRDVGGGSAAADAEAETALVCFGALIALLSVEDEVVPFH